MTLAAPRYTIKEWPTEERPRERMEALGPRALASRELLALLIETGIPASAAGGGRTSLDVAGDLLRRFRAGDGNDSLRRILAAPLAELCAVPGIGPAKAAKVQAGLELGRRAAEETRGERDRVRTPRDVYERMRLSMRDLPYEEFHLLLLNTQNEVLRDQLVSRGTVDASIVHPREVFRPAILESAAALILVHNHPSGDPTPSAEDRAVTQQLRSCGETLGIDVIDHVVIGEGRFVSFVEAGLLGG